MKALDISVIAYFLIEPDFEKADFENIAQYCSEMDISDPVFACLSAYPGTPLYNEMSPRVVDADYEYLDMLHCPYKTKMDRHDFYEQYVDLYKKIYFSGRSIDASYSDEQVQSILGVFKQEYGITS